MAYRLLSNSARCVSGIRAYSTKASLVEFLDGVPQSTFNGGVARKAQVTTLSNGLRVASVSSNYPSSALGLFINAGTRHETRHEVGSTQTLKQLAFQSSKERFGIEVVREIECSGATLNATATREHLIFSSETTPDNTKTVLSVLKGILQPSLPYHEVAFSHPVVEADAERLEACNVTKLFENVHKTAYRSKGLGQSLIANKDNIHHITNESLATFVSNYYTPSNVVVAAVGVDHSTFVEEVKAEFESLAGGKTTTQSQKSKYVGGESLTASNGNTHIAVAFEGLGADASNSKDIAALGVLGHIIGRVVPNPNSGKVIGAAGASRAAAIAGKSEGVRSVSVFNFTYSDSGLFGVYAETAADASAVAQAIQSELSSLKSGKIEEADVARGKAQLKASILEAADQRLSALEVVGVQALLNGKVVTPEDYAKAIDEVSAADVAKVAQKVLSSKPTVAAVGDVADLPAF